MPAAEQRRIEGAGKEGRPELVADQPASLLFNTSGGKPLKFDLESLEFKDLPVASRLILVTTHRDFSALD